MGSILIRQIAESHPERVSSMIMGGAIMKLNFRSQFLIRFGNIVKSIIPYMVVQFSGIYNYAKKIIKNQDYFLLEKQKKTL